MASPVATSTASHTVVIVGGVGFVGYHLVSHLINQKIFSRVAILSRSASSSSNRISGAEYFTGDLTDYSNIKSILDKLQPTIVIHAASPSPVTGTPSQLENVNIYSTRNILRIAKQSNYVRAFIYKSSSTLAKGPEYLNLDKLCALADEYSRASAYARLKPTAEIMVLHCNFPKPDIKEGDWAGYLATAPLKFPIIYGTRDPTSIPECLNALSNGQTNATLGNRKNLWSFCSAENMALLHALLASALLSPSLPDSEKRVDGEAFNINDGSPYPFWGFARLCWKYAGCDPHPPPNINHLPPWFVLVLAHYLEWVYWLFTFEPALEMYSS